VLVTIYGVLALSFMMLMYALEDRGKIITFGFAVGCPVSTDSWRAPGTFGIVELVWAGVALRRYQRRSNIERGSMR
jgi:hypothetical protein